MNGIRLKRLKCVVYCSIFQANTNFKNYTFIRPYIKDKLVACVQSFHSHSVMNQFYKFVKKVKYVKDGADHLSHTHIREVLKSCKSVPEQMNAFLSLVQLTPVEVSHRQNACLELQDIFKTVFPSCTLHIVGSTVTNLGLKSCDLDLSFQANDPGLNTLDDQSPILTKDILDGKVPPSAFPKLNPKQKLHFLHKILKEFDLCGAIIPGRFPILSFIYKGYNVDLGINNISGLKGTNLMKLCEKLDDRISPLFRCIIYWAKHFKLCGGTMKFKSYGLFLLLVYFLQSKHILPSVEILLEKTDFQKNQENWLYDVYSFAYQIEKTNNNQCKEELLQEFFFFYANFDFSSVICTSTCELVTGSTFMNDSKNNKFELNSISIQDPLNPNWNVAAGLNWKHSRLFAKELLSACDTFLQSWNPSASTDFGLLSLIDSTSPKDLRTIDVINIDVHDVTLDEIPTMAEKVHRILNYCLDFKCDFVTDKSGAVSKFLCVATSDTWMGRSNFEFMKNERTGACFYDAERDISKCMASCGKGGDKKHEFVFMCECKYHDDCFHVTLIPVNSEVFVPKLAIFLKHYILKCIYL